MGARLRVPKERREPPVPACLEAFLLHGPTRTTLKCWMFHNAEHHGIDLARAWRIVGTRLVSEWRAGLHPHRGRRGPWGLRVTPGYTPLADVPVAQEPSA